MDTDNAVPQVIIEGNTATPNFEGLHDITMTNLPPRRKPYLIMAPEDRIGTPHIPVDPERVVAIVESDYPDQTQPNQPADDTSKAIASNLIEFLEHEVKYGRLPKNLLPIQSGIGNIANAVIGGLSTGGAQFTNLRNRTLFTRPFASLQRALNAFTPGGNPTLPSSSCARSRYRTRRRSFVGSELLA